MHYAVEAEFLDYISQNNHEGTYGKAEKCGYIWNAFKASWRNNAESSKL